MAGSIPRDFQVPESFSASSTKGRIAAARLSALIEGRTVVLSRPAGKPDKDRYGRLLRDAALDGEDVGGIMIREGLARPWAD